MKRDMDIVRRITLALEDANDWLTGMEDLTQHQWALHATLLIEAGLALGSGSDDRGDPDSLVVLHRLTWAGYDFAASIRDDTLWRKAKEHVIKPGASWTFGVLTAFLRDQILTALKP